MRKSSIVLCADDFGIAPGVSHSIVELIQAARLSATGCMTVCADWPSSADALRAAVALQPADIGLHLTLTDHRAASNPADRLPALGALMRACLGRRLRDNAFRTEIHAQLDAFERHWGAPPDFVDGHQHVHLLPGVREALVDILRTRYPIGRVWVRNCVEAPRRCFGRGPGWHKALVIGLLGLGFRRLAREAGLPMNDGFSGLHDFNSGPPFREKMRNFLAHRGPRHLIHVHPGKVDPQLQAVDSLTSPREWELCYLASDEFLRDLETAGVALARFEPTACGQVQATAPR